MAGNEGAVGTANRTQAGSAISTSIRGSQLTGLASVYILVTIALGIATVALLILADAEGPVVTVAILQAFVSAFGGYLVWSLAKRSSEHADSITLLSVTRDEE